MHEFLQNKVDTEAFTEEMRFDLGLPDGRIYTRANLPDNSQEGQLNLNFA